MGSSEVEQANENPFVAPDTIEDAPDGTPDDEPDAPDVLEPPEDEPEARGPTPEHIEANLAKIGKRADTYTKFATEQLQDADQEVLRCPLCITGPPGFLDRGMIGQYPREAVAQVNEIMTGFKQVEYRQLPGFETCPTCDGEGKGYTGSKVPSMTYSDCPTCKARGYIAPGLEQANGHVEEHAQFFAAPDEAPYNAGDDVDEWGEPKTLPDGRDNPNFGKMPHRKILVEPYGVTAALTREVGV